MKAIGIVMALVCAGVLEACAEAPKPMKVVLLVGQSNMAGRGKLLPEDRAAIPNAVMLNAKGEWVPARSPVHFDRKMAGVGLCTSFARAWLADHPGEVLGLVPCAVGGTPIERWMPGRDLYTNAVARAKRAQRDAPLLAILWHQGETNLEKPKTLPTYVEKAVRLFTAMRKELGAERVPIILGQVGPWIPEVGEFNTKTLPSIVQAVPLSGLVSSEGLKNQDRWHFERESVIELGNRYYQKYKEVIAGGAASATATGDYPYQPAEMNDVTITGGFWLPRIETNRMVTVWTDFRKSEETGRIANFEKAARHEKGTFKGIPFDDSDVYKIIEGAAYTLAKHPDPKLDAYLDNLIAKIAGAQEPDGYLYTARTLGFTNAMTGPVRFSALGGSHELYNAGHLYEAAVAHYRVTGKKTLLEVATKNADLLCKTFGLGEGQNRGVPGHEEIEIGLCKLYRATGEKKYLDLAKHFLDMRGRKDLRGRVNGEYCQDHRPVIEQKEAVGHAVRAGYLYCGMADVAALTGNAAYLAAIDRLWEDVVGKKLHLNGGIGARHRGEAFGAAYELPNETAYLETCAAIANALWNERMFLLHGEAKYIDVLERVIYNGFLSGISLSGDEFFYPNPLASKGKYARSKWFGCSCCPVNIVRFLPQIGSFAYAHRGDGLYWNLFIDSRAMLTVGGAKVALRQATAYPWKGESSLTIEPANGTADFTLYVRVPGWAIGEPVPSDLYTQTTPGSLGDVTVKVNGVKQELKLEKGYLPIRRTWKAGDTVAMTMEMPVRRIRAADAVKDDRGRLAVERGPVVYCLEGADNGGKAFAATLPAAATFRDAEVSILGNTFPALETVSEPRLKLIPYFAWNHRGTDEMQCWPLK